MQALQRRREKIYLAATLMSNNRITILLTTGRGYIPPPRDNTYRTAVHAGWEEAERFVDNGDGTPEASCRSEDGALSRRARN